MEYHGGGSQSSANMAAKGGCGGGANGGGRGGGRGNSWASLEEAWQRSWEQLHSRSNLSAMRQRGALRRQVLQEV
jgi:hypothetical protein